MLIKKATTAYPILFQMVDATDGFTPETGLTPVVTLSKAGGAFAAAAGAVTEISSGWYQVAGNAADTGTDGALILKATGVGSRDAYVVNEVVSFDPRDTVRLGLTALPNAAADAAGGLVISDAGGLDIDALNTQIVGANGVETGISLKQALRLAVAVLAGRASGGGTATLVYKTPDNSATRLTLTVDSNGNRSASTPAA